MRRMRFAARGAALALLATLCVATVGSAVTLDAQSYFTFGVGQLEADIQTLSAAAATQDYAVLSFTGNSVSVLHAPLAGPADVQSMMLSAERLLVLDGARFYLRSSGPTLTYAIRPVHGGLELVLSPKAPIDVVEALTAVIVELQDLGVGGMDVGLDGYRSVARNALKGPAEPQDLASKLDYALYGLMVSEDWFSYAHGKGIALLGLHLEVVVEKLPNAEIPSDFRSAVSSETADLASLVVAVDQLAPLARSAGVGYVRLPYVPVAP